MNVPFSIVGPGILVIESDRLVQTDEYKRQTTALGKIKADIFRPAPMEWQPIETAPKDGTTIIGWCDHEADSYFDKEHNRLTSYGANAEGMKYANNGVNLIRWHGIIDEGEYTIPAWWCVDDELGETAANPTHWMSLPRPPKGRRAEVCYEDD